MSITAEDNLRSFQKFASSELRSPENGAKVQVIFENKTSIKLRYTHIDNRGHMGSTGLIFANRDSDPVDVRVGDFYVITTRRTGSYLRVFEIPSFSDKIKKLAINPTDILPPNFIGSPPVASNSQMMPSGSPTVLVGISDAQEGNDGKSFILLREQAWQHPHRVPADGSNTHAEGRLLAAGRTAGAVGCRSLPRTAGGVCDPHANNEVDCADRRRDRSPRHATPTAVSGG